MSAAVSKELCLPVPAFVASLNLEPMPLASPDSPFAVPSESRDCSARTEILSYKLKKGGSDKLKMQQQCDLGDFLHHVLINNPVLHLPTPQKADDSAWTVHKKMLSEVKNEMTTRSKNAYQLWCADNKHLKNMNEMWAKTKNENPTLVTRYEEIAKVGKEKYAMTNPAALKEFHNKTIIPSWTRASALRSANSTTSESKQNKERKTNDFKTAAMTKHDQVANVSFYVVSSNTT